MINSGDLLENMVDLVNEFYEESMQASAAAMTSESGIDERNKDSERGDIKTENVEDDDEEGGVDDEEDEEDSEDDDSEDDSDEEEEEEEDSSDEGDDLLLQEQKKPKQQALSGSFSFTGSTPFPINNSNNNSNNNNSSTARVSFNNNTIEQRQPQQQNIFVGSVGSSMSLLNRRQANQTPINSRKHARTDNNSGIKFYFIKN
jgi:hypothetical protein